MPVYFFHLHECGTIIEDVDGVDVPDAAAARAVAIRAARDIMAGEIKDGKLCLSCSIVIESDDRTEIDRLLFKDAVKVVGLDRA